MHCVINSIYVIAIGLTVAWLVGAFLFVQFGVQLPFVSWLVFFLICRRGFRHHRRIQTHCGWTTLGGGIVGLLLFPSVQIIGRLTVLDELSGFGGEFGMVNASLVGAAALLILLAVLECKNSPVPGASDSDATDRRG